MSTLASWMKDNGWDDAKLADEVGLNRTQISRIRRGESGTSKPKAQAIERITGIPWPTFIGPVAQTGARA